MPTARKKKPPQPRITAKRIDLAKRAAAEDFHMVLTDALARKVLESDRSLIAELGDDGALDTAGRDYFGMALLEVIMPGKPTVQDSLISTPLKCWHWPCFGSGDEYTLAFAQSLAAAMKSHGVKLRRRK